MNFNSTKDIDKMKKKITSKGCLCMSICCSEAITLGVERNRFKLGCYLRKLNGTALVIVNIYPFQYKIRKGDLLI